MSYEELKRKIHRVNFRKWAELEDLQEQLTGAAEKDEFPDSVYAYISAALGCEAEELDALPWHETIELYMEASTVNFPSSNLPIVTATDKKTTPAKLDWDYAGRTWPMYAHMIAKTYGWTLGYIGELEIDTALALLQEILTDEQLDREFLWGMSEIAYPYNKSTKQNKFQPLHRPYWMLPVAKEIKQITIRADMLPQGLIINAGAKTTESP